MTVNGITSFSIQPRPVQAENEILWEGGLQREKNVNARSSHNIYKLLYRDLWKSWEEKAKCANKQKNSKQVFKNQVIVNFRENETKQKRNKTES